MSSWLNWSQSSGGATYYPTTITTSGTNLTPFPLYVQPQPLPSVMEAVGAPMGDRDWLDSQIAEVCDLAQAA